MTYTYTGTYITELIIKEVVLWIFKDSGFIKGSLQPLELVLRPLLPKKQYFYCLRG